MNAAITVDSVSKVYQIGKNRAQGYRTLRESITDGMISRWNGLRARVGVAGLSRPDPGIYWALKDVSFEIQPGEVVGIIGRNGAGKSTLLKILSRITEPSSGRAQIRGRIGSLLEVGTGFHPELTGRENIYLNGSILGMSSWEISRRFDEIVRFSEISDFLDTPVKRYSSGMYVRLAFAVAAHLEPEILLVDEVLAVGDATYQKRCIDRMSQIARSGRSVLFVSHNMDLIPRLCARAILLDRGRVAASGAASQVVKDYLEKAAACSRNEDLATKQRFGDGRARFTHVWLLGPDGSPSGIHPSGDDLTVRLRIQSTVTIADAALAISISTPGGTKIHSSWTREMPSHVNLNEGVQDYQCHFRNIRLRPGQRMILGLWLEAGSVVDCVEDALTFEVGDGLETGSFSTNRDQGIVLCDYNWSRLDDAHYGSVGA